MKIKLSKYYRWQSNLDYVEQEGFAWKNWKEWYFVWRFCGFGYEETWWGGPEYFWKFGIFSIEMFWVSDFHERTNKLKFPLRSPELVVY